MSMGGCDTPPGFPSKRARRSEEDDSIVQPGSSAAVGLDINTLIQETTNGKKLEGSVQCFLCLAQLL